MDGPRYIFDSACTNSNRPRFYEICRSYGFDEWDHQDDLGKTIVHEGAAFGNGEDIEMLLKMGASPVMFTIGNHWLPVQYAVKYDNQSTFDVFAEETPLLISMLTDNRGWTLLHLAAQYGSTELISNLLNRGLDPRAKSHSSTLPVPGRIERVEATPLDVAKACGREDVYLAAEQSAGKTSD
jgi:ankyrin repeat protein